MITYKDYLDKITLEELKQHYEVENMSISEICEYFGISQAIFVRILKYYNFHKSKSAHTKNIKKAKKEKYGDENYNNAKKTKQTCIEKYGVDNQFKRSDMMSEVREQNLEKYGSKNNIYKNLQTRIKNSGSISESYKNQIASTRATVREKYGVDWASKSDLIKDRIRESLKETFNDKYGCDNYWVSPEAIRSNGSKNSHANLNFAQLLDKYGINYEQEFLLDNRYYDFKIDNTLIEINPTATHNSTWSPWCKDTGLDKHYHADKTDIAVNNGYRCIHIWDWDNAELVVKTLLQPKERIAARNCDIKVVDKDAEIDFLNNNHFQGYVKSELAYGLYNNNELVMIMTFGKPRYSKKYKWEVLRICSSKSVIGGNERLFKHFLAENNPESIVSYCDLSKFEGNVYKNLGFKKSSRSICRHWYSIKLNDHITDHLLFSRGFDALLGKTFGYFGKGSDNEQLMLEHDFVEIFDAGQATYIWTKTGPV